MANQLHIGAETKLYCVLGDPVGHSLSPLMHNAAFARVGVNGVYTAFQVKDVGAAVAAIRALGIKGASITIPHKVAVLAHLDHRDELVAKIGAANTIRNDRGMLRGFNSDSLGAVKALAEKTTLDGRTVAVIGAGGAARAVAFGVMDSGARVTILNRSIARGETLARDLGADFCRLEDVRKVRPQILINTTPVGMAPDWDASPVPGNCLEEGMVVMDAIYNPVKTRLLTEAESRGCLTVDGVAMFVYQGALQFEWWTGRAAPIDEMRQAVLDGLDGR